MRFFDEIFEVAKGFCDATGELVSGIGHDFVELCSGVSDITKEAINEIAENPVKYAFDSTIEVSNAISHTIITPVRPVINMLEGFNDAVFCETVTPVVGSVLYTDLCFGYAEHSGIYIGQNQIVELNAKGCISVVTPEEFISGGTGVHIYVSSFDGCAVGSKKAAKRAKYLINSQRDYNFLLSNCHQFTAGCLTNEFENGSSFLWMLKNDCQTYLGANEWRIWDV